MREQIVEHLLNYSLNAIARVEGAKDVTGFVCVLSQLLELCCRVIEIIAYGTSLTHCGWPEAATSGRLFNQSTFDTSINFCLFLCGRAGGCVCSSVCPISSNAANVRFNLGASAHAHAINVMFFPSIII